MIAASDVRAWLRLPATPPDPDLDRIVGAVNSYVAELPIVANRPLVDGAPAAWPAHVTHAAIMLAGRLHRRRNTPAGVEGFTEEGGASYVSRYDPDLDRLLELGGHLRPAVG